jgi:hypothetical protein
MQQSVHAAQVIELAEFLLENALEISPAEGTHLILRPRAGLDADHKLILFFDRQLGASSLSGTSLQTFHARLVVATHPLLNRSPRRAQRVGDFLRRTTLFGQHDSLHPNPHPGIALRSSQTPQLAQSVAIFNMHPASPSQRT